MKPFPLIVPCRLLILQEDIDEGEPCRFLTCPTAIALDRLLPAEYHVDVRNRIIFVEEWDWEEMCATSDFFWQIEIPLGLRMWMATFDSKGPVEPATFVLDDVKLRPYFSDPTHRRGAYEHQVAE